jgi:replicative DNA helicase
MGKSAYCLGQLKQTAIEEGKGVIYCGAQMDKNRIFLRIIAQMCNLNFRQLVAGRFPKEKTKEVMKAHEIISKAPIKHIILPERISLLDLQMSVTTALRQTGVQVELLIIENLQQLFWPGKDFGKNSFEEANFMIKKLKPWAQEINPAVIVSSQLNRKVSEREDKHPDTTDIFSKDAEELADTILLLFRPNVYEKRTIEEPGRPERDAVIIIGKGGPPVEVPMTFWGDSMLWEGID